MPASRSARLTRSKAQRSPHSRPDVRSTTAAAESSEEDNQAIPSGRPNIRRSQHQNSSSLNPNPSTSHGPPPKRQRHGYASTFRERENDNNVGSRNPGYESTLLEDYSQTLLGNRGGNHDSTAEWLGDTTRSLEEQFTGPDGADIAEDTKRRKPRPDRRTEESMPLDERDAKPMVTVTVSSDEESEEDSDDSEEEPTRGEPVNGQELEHQQTALQRGFYSHRADTDVAHSNQDRVLAQATKDTQQEHAQSFPVNGNEPEPQETVWERDVYSFESDSDDSSGDLRTVAKHGNENYESDNLFVSSEPDENIGPVGPGSSSQDNDLHQNPEFPRLSDQDEASTHLSAHWSVSDYFRPPEGNADDVPLLELPSFHLGLMLGYMSTRGWTESRTWKEDDLFEELSRIQNAPGSILNDLEEVAKNAGSLSRLCQDIPPVADHTAHTTRLQQQQTVHDLAYGLHAIDLYTSNCAKKLATKSHSTDNGDRRDAAKAAKKLHETVIPCLVLLLEQAFILGSIVFRRELDVLPAAGSFSLSTVRVLLRVTEWIQNLYSAMQRELHRNKPKKIDASSLKLHMQNRYLFKKPLERFLEFARKAFTQLGGRQEEQQRERQLAIGNDRLARQAREEQLQQTQEARAKQMRLFYASMQKLPLSRQRQPQASGSSASSQITTTSRGQPPQVRKGTTNQAYSQDNGGWTWDEDHELLTKIRGDFRPDITELADEFGRGFDDIQDRIDYLKVLARKKFRERGETPPVWWSPQ